MFGVNPYNIAKNNPMGSRATAYGKVLERRKGMLMG
jgi:hypothetical protein